MKKIPTPYTQSTLIREKIIDCESTESSFSLIILIIAWSTFKAIITAHSVRGRNSFPSTTIPIPEIRKIFLVDAHKLENNSFGLNSTAKSPIIGAEGISRSEMIS